ncbi:MAG: AarF/ABC1/UbiB kinase family protein [Leptospiraceae bacterium]|nr:AarF/ABC1/UbiB kinase family protein [Leptospiraceae bacterium]MCP5512724.1 AarF/ABC1/UbiB kinase family protein [Leptospiraceae bacterium]
MDLFSNIYSGVQGTFRILDSGKVFSMKASQIIIDMIWEKKDPNLPVRLREAFEELGATYIKLGQFIASAPSLFPKEFTTEMERCLDRVRPLPFSVIQKVVETELGGPLSQFFQSVDEIPIASASISQVHGAITREGLDVVLKVQRPDIEYTLQTDMNLIYLATVLFSRLSPGMESSGLLDIVKDFYENILQEVDFRKEADNIEEYDRFLIENAENRAVVPRVYRQYSTGRLLTMERFYGVPLTDLHSIRKYTKNPQETLTTALNIWFDSLGKARIFHADVHAGNLLLLKDGRIGFIDFGIVGRISPKVWEGLLFFMQGIGTENAAMMAKGLVQMDSTSNEIDEVQFGKDLENVLKSLREIGESVQSGNLEMIDETKMNRIMFDISDVSKRAGLKIPREFGLLIKQMLYFDRYVKILAPEMDLIRDQKLYLK